MLVGEFLLQFRQRGGHLGFFGGFSGHDAHVGDEILISVVSKLCFRPMALIRLANAASNGV
jgi:hypothetical protein